mmetsp:Transcript_20049/g.60941  ORF Transcript_20049/g.60941 Transcript_20049/m.60941 type:complete len:260 (+) Transcript_20049:1128-1907(+)
MKGARAPPARRSSLCLRLSGAVRRAASAWQRLAALLPARARTPTRTALRWPRCRASTLRWHPCCCRRSQSPSRTPPSPRVRPGLSPLSPMLSQPRHSRSLAEEEVGPRAPWSSSSAACSCPARWAPTPLPFPRWRSVWPTLCGWLSGSAATRPGYRAHRTHVWPHSTWSSSRSTCMVPRLPKAARRRSSLPKGAVSCASGPRSASRAAPWRSARQSPPTALVVLSCSPTPFPGTAASVHREWRQRRLRSCLRRASGWPR